MDEDIKAGNYSGRSQIVRTAIEELIDKNYSQDRSEEATNFIQDVKP